MDELAEIGMVLEQELEKAQESDSLSLCAQPTVHAPLRKRAAERSGDVGAGSEGGETALPDQRAAATAQGA